MGRKVCITRKSIERLRQLFAEPCVWTSRPQPTGAEDRYDIFFPGYELRQSVWGLGARLKIRRVANLEVWGRGALLGVYTEGNSSEEGTIWREWVSLVLWPLPRDHVGPLEEWGWFGPEPGKYWPGMRELRVSPPAVVLRLPGTTGRCFQDVVVGPIGSTVTRIWIGGRGKDLTDTVEISAPQE